MKLRTLTQGLALGARTHTFLTTYDDGPDCDGRTKRHTLFYFVYLAISIAVGYSSLYTVAVVISVINAVVFLYCCRIGIFRTLRANLRKDLKRIIMRAPGQELRVELPRTARRPTGWSPKRIGLNVLTIILIVVMVNVGFFGYHPLAGAYYQLCRQRLIDILRRKSQISECGYKDTTHTVTR